MTQTLSAVSAQRRAMLAEMFGAIDRKDVESLLGYFAPDGTQRFGNAAPLRGHDQIREGNTAFLGSIAGLSHEILTVWESEEGVVIRLSVSYERLDGSAVTLPAVTIIREQEGLIQGYEVYFDIAPVFNPAIASTVQ
jgi:ketosteroid isomerase-like protein